MDFAGHVPNYVNPESLGGMVLAVNVACCTIATVFASIRLFVRIKILHSAGWDDLAAALATIMFIISCVLSSITSTKYGFGKHIWDIEPSLLTPQLKLALTISCLYNPIMMAIKLSILFFYLRIFSCPTLRKIVFGMIALTVTATIAFTVATLLRCAPVSFYWNRSIPNGSCIDLEVLVYVNAVFGIITDVAIWALPIPILRSLDLNLRKKYALFFVFSLGLCACIASILRLHVLRYVGILSDATWTNVGVNIWSQIEISTAITCACLPPLKPLLSKLFGGIFDSHRGTYVNTENSRIKNSQDIYALHQPPKGEVPKGPPSPKANVEEILPQGGTGFEMDIESGMFKGAINVTASLGPP